jgi:hypothetical protein
MGQPGRLLMSSMNGFSKVFIEVNWIRVKIDVGADTCHAASSADKLLGLVEVMRTLTISPLRATGKSRCTLCR